MRPQGRREMAARRGHAQVREGEPIFEEYARWPGDAALHTGLGFHRDSAEPLVLVDRSGVRLRLDVRDERTSADPHIGAQRAGLVRQSTSIVRWLSPCEKLSRRRAGATLPS